MPAWLLTRMRTAKAFPVTVLFLPTVIQFNGQVLTREIGKLSFLPVLDKVPLVEDMAVRRDVGEVAS